MSHPVCCPAAWRQWAVLSGVWLLALLPAFFFSFPLPPHASLVESAWWLSLSGSKYGLPFVGLLLLFLVARNRQELVLLVLPALLFVGLGAAFNEHLLKPWMNEPRPDIEWLSSEEAGPVLPEGAEAFYRIQGKAARSSRLESRLAQSGLVLAPRLAGHWIAETGFSFPSGHAFAAAALGGWFLFWMLCWQRRRWLSPLIVLWSVGVSWSRLMLGVHRPEDVLAGSAQGLLLAALAALLVSWWQGRAGYLEPSRNQ